MTQRSYLKNVLSTPKIKLVSSCDDRKCLNGLGFAYLGWLSLEALNTDYRYYYSANKQNESGRLDYPSPLTQKIGVLKTIPFKVVNPN